MCLDRSSPTSHTPLFGALWRPLGVQLSSMGRKKIKIEKIPNERHRWVTFNKRKAGLVRKATELAILCEAEVGVIIFSAAGRMSLYSNTTNTANMDDLLTKVREYKETPEVRHSNLARSRLETRDRATKSVAGKASLSISPRDPTRTRARRFSHSRRFTRPRTTSNRRPRRPPKRPTTTTTTTTRR